MDMRLYIFMYIIDTILYDPLINISPYFVYFCVTIHRRHYRDTLWIPNFVTVTSPPCYCVIIQKSLLISLSILILIYTGIYTTLSSLPEKYMKYCEVRTILSYFFHIHRSQSNILSCIGELITSWYCSK